MPGPPPKDPRRRQRRNKVSTKAKLQLAQADEIDIVPALPERGKNEKPWHSRTVQFWKMVWCSPMAGEYLPADVPGLEHVAELEDLVNYGDHSVMAELRLQRQCFGLTPLDRRRLQWEIERGESAEKRRVKSTAPKPRRGKDPRSYLRAVK